MLQNSFAYKVCTSRAGDGTRVWLEGARLVASGFHHRALVARHWHKGRLTLTLIDQAAFDALPRSERSTVAGAAARPIIDICGAAVKAAFPAGQILVTFDHGTITIEGTY